MALVLKDRVQETCNSPGTGAVSLLGPVTGFQAFSAAIGNGNTCYYTIADQSGPNWEVGIGTYSSTGNTFTRTTVISSSNGGATTNFASGVQNIFVTYPAETSVYTDTSGNAVLTGTLTAAGFSGAGTGITGTAVGLSVGGNAATATTAGALTNGGALNTPASGNLGSCTGYTYANLSGTVPTWNQSTTGNAATATTASTCSGNAATASALANGGALNTPASGNLGNCSGYTYASLSGTVPTWNQNTTGNAATATTASTANALANGAALGTPASGTLTNCTGYTYANLSGTVPTWNQNTTGNAATATAASTAATASNPASGGTFVTSSNIGSQSVNYATSAGSASSCSGNAATATSPSGGGSFITSSNIGSQSVNYAASAGSSSSCSGNAATVTNGVYTSSFPSSLGASGYQKLPNGWMIQWGAITESSHAASSSGSSAITFPTSFPTVCLRMMADVAATSGGSIGKCSYTVATTGYSTTGMTAYWDNEQTASVSFGCNWIAIGY